MVMLKTKQSRYCGESCLKKSYSTPYIYSIVQGLLCICYFAVFQITRNYSLERSSSSLGIFLRVLLRENWLYAVRGVFYLKDTCYFNFSANVGPGTNNKAELLPLRALLKLDALKALILVQVFGNSSMGINRAPHDIILHSLAQHVKEVSSLFPHISFTHVFMELNKDIDSPF